MQTFWIAEVFIGKSDSFYAETLLTDRIYILLTETKISDSGLKDVRWRNFDL